MGRDTAENAAKSPKQTRDDRLKAALKANLQKRKAQARARDADDKKNEAE